METHAKILVLVLVFSVVESIQEFNWMDTGICQTDECKIIGRELLQGMNKSVDPCDNFYEYMCGNWVKKHTVPPFMPWWNRVFIFQDTIYRRIKDLLEISPKTSDILPVRQIKKWFHSCMNTEKLDRRGLGPLESILVQTGGWPMILDAEEWDIEEQSWLGIEDHYFHVTGSYVFYKISTSTYENNSIELNIGKLPLQDELQYEFRNHSGNTSLVYKAVIKGVAQMFIKHNKANVSNKTLDKDIENLVEFERKLYMLSESDTNNREIMSIQTIDEFINFYENEIALEKIEKIDFLHLIQQTFDMINFHIDKSEKLYVRSKPYWANLTKLLNSTPTRTIVNYIHWNIISRMLRYTTEDIRDMLFALAENELDLSARPPRWWECVREMKMTTAMSYAFVQKYFPNETEQSAREMIENIRKGIEHQIITSRWIDAEAKKLAVDKLNAMEIFVAFPEWYKNKTRVVNAYKGLIIGTEYLDNILSYQKYNIKRQLKLINRMSAEERADDDTININAMYSYGSNSIRLPAADFQAPLFTQHLPLAINYGMTGAIIGHEIGHGFDNDGFNVGPDGHKADVSKYVRETYYKRAECFVRQYNNYNGVTESDIQHRYPSGGRLTQGENIADSTGLHAVYEAYRKEIATKSDFKLPGFEDFTNDQLFFAAFGALWCEVKTPKFAKLSESSDSHSTGRLRCIGSVSNINDFAKAFNCPPASPMNPINKCDIWDAPEPYETAAAKMKFVVD